MFGASLGIIDSGGAGGGGGSYESIATAVGTGSSGTITFSSIPSTYKHLQIRSTSARITGAGFASLEFNNDSSAIYATHRLIADGTSVTAQGQTGRTNTFYSILSGPSSISNVMGVSIVDIIDYASSTKNKTVRSFTGYDTNGNVSEEQSLYLTSALWPSTSAITSIKIIASGGVSFTNTSVFSLYGIKG
jgi:hypothetical protein